MNQVSQEEIAASVIQPHFDAVKDEFCAWDDDLLAKLTKIKFIVDPDIHNTPRHFAATRDDGLLMMFAPQIIDLDQDVLVAILAHEFGHASDFLYPHRWVTPLEVGGAAVFVTDEDQLESREYKAWRKLWRSRNADQIEWAADSIARAVTGRKIKYAGDCVLQTFGRGIQRPEGLR